MGGLAHYLEDEGIPTTQVSLIREHTEIIRPPRALWVSFEMGRPLGSPDQPDFQRRVLYAALKLFEAESGPILANFPEAAPAADLIEGWACSVSFAPPPIDDADRAAQLLQELEQLTPWRDLWLETRGRTTVGASELEIDVAAAYMAGFLTEAEPEPPRTDRSPADLMKLILEDVKAFYLEAALAQPGESSSQAVNDWFWGETTAGQIMLNLHPILLGHSDKQLRFLARALLVPQLQRYRLASAPAS